MGPCERVHWHRVVLDESHAIKGAATNQAKVVKQLVSEYRWCVTGTPFCNSLEDVVGQFEFIKAPAGNMGAYLKIQGQSQSSKKLVLTALRSCLIRHEKSQKLDGK